MKQPRGDDTGEARRTALPAGAPAAAAARALARAQLRTWDREDLTDTVLLLTSEVVTNAVVHATAAPELTITRDGSGIRVQVFDDSLTPPVQRRHSLTAATGRGVRLLADLADEWGWEVLPSGKVVWFRVSGRHDPSAASTAQQQMGERA